MLKVGISVPQISAIGPVRILLSSQIVSKSSGYTGDYQFITTNPVILNLCPSNVEMVPERKDVSKF